MNNNITLLAAIIFAAVMVLILPQDLTAQYSRLEAFDYLLENVLADSAGICEVYCSIDPVEAQSAVILAFDEDTLISPDYTSWLFMADWDYDFDWSHDAHLYFIDVDSLQQFTHHLVGMWVVEPQMDTLGFGGLTYQREEVIEYLTQVVLADSSGTYRLSVLHWPLVPNIRVWLDDERIDAPDYYTWLFQADWNYNARWAHPAHLYFINVDSLENILHYDVDWWVTNHPMDDLGLIESRFSRDQTFDYLTQNILSDSSGVYYARGSHQVVDPESIVRLAGQDTIVSPDYSSWLFMADWNYMMRWTHYAHLYFISIDSMPDFAHYQVGWPVVEPEMDSLALVGVTYTSVEAMDYLTRVILGDSTDYEVHISRYPVEPEFDVVLADHDHTTYISPNFRTWLFMADWNYNARWAHEAHLYFLNVDSLHSFTHQMIEWWVQSPQMDPLGVVDVAIDGNDCLQPGGIGICDVYPNPFNSTLTIRYNLLQTIDLTLSIYDLSGRLVEKLITGQQMSGSHEYIWDTCGVSSGIYLVRMDNGEQTFQNKVVLVR